MIGEYLITPCSHSGSIYILLMHVVSKSTLREFWGKRPDSKTPLMAWYREASKATWQNPAQVKAIFGSADVVKDNRIIFDIGGNKYRLVVHFHYSAQIARIKFIGTHNEYDKIDPSTV